MTSSGAQGLLTLPVAPLNLAYDMKPGKAGNKAVSTPSTRRVSAKQKEICGLFQSIVSFSFFLFFVLSGTLFVIARSWVPLSSLVTLLGC